MLNELEHLIRNQMVCMQYHCQTGNKIKCHEIQEKILTKLEELRAGESKAATPAK